LITDAKALKGTSNTLIWGEVTLINAGSAAPGSGGGHTMTAKLTDA